MVEVIVFLAGASVMILEMLGSRVLAPYVGTSIFIWTSLIGIILGCLSIGYWLGGRIADKHPQIKLLGVIILATAIWVIGLTAAKEVVMTLLINTGWTIKTISVVATIILFGCPSVLLGMVSPFAIRLRLADINKTGHTAGNLFAVSTIGSIIGTFASGFWLIPVWGTTTILYILAGMLAFTAILALSYEKFNWLQSIGILALLAVITIMSLPIASQATYNKVADLDTPYARLWIIDRTMPEFNNRPARIMVKSLTESYSAIFLDDQDIVFDYAKAYRLDKFFKSDINHTLLIGGAAYTMATDYLKRFENATIDVVEIDPDMAEIAAKYFFLDKDNPRLNIYDEDARTFFNTAEPNQYDIIYSDAFNSSLSIPYQLATREAVELQYNMLRNNGMIMMNIISSLKGSPSLMLQTEYNTFKEYFPNILLFPIKTMDPYDVQNILLVAFKNPDFNVQDLRDKLPELSLELKSYLQQQWLEPIPNNLPILTDEYAPMDYYGSLLLN